MISKKKYCLLGLILFVSIASAQQYPFINYNESHLHYSKDSTSWMEFYKKIDELRENKRTRINILHYGGSHIQAGFWPEVLMDGFQSLGKFEGGGTFIFPFKIVKANSPHFFKSFTTGNWKRCRAAISKEMCNNLGMAGMAGITNDSANTFGFKLMENNHHKQFNSVKVYHNFNPSFELSLNHQVGLPFERKDEKEKGYTEFIFETFIDSLNFSLLKKDSAQKDFMLRGFSIENTNNGFYYGSMGVNGASSSSFLRCGEFVNELKSIHPDLAIFSLGVNDTHDPNFSKQTYLSNYDSLITQIKKTSPNCVFLFVTTTDNYIRRKTPNKRPIQAAEASYELMEKHNGAVYDLYAVMGGYKSIMKWYKVGLAAKDKVHFSGKGYKLFAGLMFTAIENSYRYNSKIK